MKRTMILGLAVFLTGCGASSDAPQADSGIHHITAPIFGCQQLKTVQRITQLNVEGDKAAALDFIRGGLASGECSEFSKGAEVYLEEARFDGLYRVREKGSALSYWTIKEVVGP
jgi:hypothetical protein